MRPGFGSGLVLGIVIGLAAGALLAPKSGRENRQAMLEHAPSLAGEAPVLRDRIVGELRARWEAGRAAFLQGRDDARSRLEQEFAQARAGVPGPRP